MIPRKGELGRGHSKGVEDGVDVAEGGQEAAQRLDVSDLRDVPVLRELVFDMAAVLDDVRPVLREGAGHILEQPRPVPRVDSDLDAEAARGAATVPGDLRESLRVPAQRLDVRAVLTVDRDALPHRDVADDLVARERRAALRQADEHVVDAAYGDPQVLARDRMTGPRRLERNGLLLGHL